MFTGIIEETGELIRLIQGSDSAVLTVRARKVLESTAVGDSIAVNGVCLTVTRIDASGFDADVMPETVRRSSLGGLPAGSRVNLERAMAADGRFGGHIVAGHVDGTGIVRNINTEKNAVLYTVEADPGILRYVVEKGSVAVDGISLTVVSVTDRELTVSVIPHTREVTNLRDRRIGDSVNLETDIIGKYVERLLNHEQLNLGQKEEKNGITMDLLADNGFI